MKYSGIIIITLIFSSLVVWSSWSQEEMQKIDHSVFEKPGRPEAVFVHDEHNETAELDDCAVCHHVYEGKELVPGESSEDSLCSDCHDLNKNEENSMPLVIAFHKRCRGCHFEEKNGPVLCGECHVKGPGRT